MDITFLIEFLGWCTVVNCTFLLIVSIILILFRDFTIKLHSQLTGVSVTALPELYFSYIGNFKLVIIAFNLTPYIALKLIV
jgi:hypothetical protein